MFSTIMSIQGRLRNDVSYLVDTCASNFSYDAGEISDFFACNRVGNLDLNFLQTTFLKDSTASMIYRVSDIGVPRGVISEMQFHNEAIERKIKYLYRQCDIPFIAASFIEAKSKLLLDMSENISGVSLTKGLHGVCYNFVKAVGDEHLSRNNLDSRVDEEVVARGLALLLSKDKPVTIISYDPDVKKLLSYSINELGNPGRSRKTSDIYDCVADKIIVQGIGVSTPDEVGSREPRYDFACNHEPKLPLKTNSFLGYLKNVAKIKY